MRLAISSSAARLLLQHKTIQAGIYRPARAQVGAEEVEAVDVDAAKLADLDFAQGAGNQRDFIRAGVLRDAPQGEMRGEGPLFDRVAELMRLGLDGLLQG